MARGEEVQDTDGEREQRGGVGARKMGSEALI